jgi:TolB-like protein
MQRFLTELKQRKVYKVAVVYAGVAWLLLQLVDVIFPPLGLPEWSIPLVLVIAAVGFPVALVLAWVFDLTPEGVTRTQTAAPTQLHALSLSRVIEFALIGALVCAVGYLYLDRIALQRDKAEVERMVSTKAVAVLPFEDLTASRDHDWLADGMTEELQNSLARLPELHVIARTSAFFFKDKATTLDEIAVRLDVDYIVEGSVRRDGSKLRLTAKLIRVSDEVQLWSNTYDRLAQDIFAVQLDVAESIAKALDVVLDDSQREFMLGTGTRNVEAFEAFLKGRSIFDAVHRGDRSTSLWAANQWFEKAIALDPSFGAAHYMHHDAYPHFLMSGGADPMASGAANPNMNDVLAMNQMRTDLNRAVENIGDQSLRASIQLDRTILIDSWHRLPEIFSRLEVFAANGHTETRLLGWTDLVLAALGQAETTLKRAENQLRTDPYEPLNWINGAMALLALGRSEDAIEYLQRGRQLAGDHEFMYRIEAMALLVQGKTESAAEIFMKEETLTPLAHALRGQESRARESAAVIEQRNPRQEELILVFAVLNDKANVDRLSRALDESPAGSLQLLRVMSYAAGRVPFNIQKTPNFRSRLEEGGIDPDSLEAWKPQRD